MPSLNEVDIAALFTMLKGEPGTRKSTVALSYPTPQYWFSTDKKMEALALPAKRWGVDMKQVEYDDYNDWDGPKKKLEQLQLNCKYKTLILDSVTSFGDASNNQVRKFKRKDNSGKLIGGISVNGLEEYNAEAAVFQELIALLKDIHSYHRVNIILIAHVVGQRKADEGNNLTHHSRVIITGGDKISGKLASYMTEVYHFNVESSFNADAGEGKYTFYTSHTGNDYARTSLPLPRKVEFGDIPVYDRIISPAIAQLKNEQPIVKLPTQNLTPPTNPSFVK